MTAIDQIYICQEVANGAVTLVALNATGMLTIEATSPLQFEVGRRYHIVAQGNPWTKKYDIQIQEAKMELAKIQHEHVVAMGVPEEVIPQAAASGITLQTLLQFILTYGLPIVSYLAQVFGWKLPPFPIPTPPPLPTPPAPPK